MPRIKPGKNGKMYPSYKKTNGYNEYLIHIGTIKKINHNKIIGLVFLPSQSQFQEEEKQMQPISDTKCIWNSQYGKYNFC